MSRMTKITDQQSAWAGDWGNEYVTRNPKSIAEYTEIYQKDYNCTRESMNEEFLGSLDRSISILEVGANVGVQLEYLQQMGFKNVRGIDVNEQAIEEAKRIRPAIMIEKASGFALPFPDASFDLVFTSGVLIHISPKDIGVLLGEIHRVSKRYIWGFEYYADAYTEVPYRGKNDLLWKTNFAKEYTDRFPALRTVHEKKFPMTDGVNVSQMFLLEK